MLNSANVILADQRKCAISEFFFVVVGGGGGGGYVPGAPPLDLPLSTTGCRIRALPLPP